MVASRSAPMTSTATARTPTISRILPSLSQNITYWPHTTKSLGISPPCHHSDRACSVVISWSTRGGARQSQPACFSAMPSFQIFVMWAILPPPLNCMT